MEKRDDVKIKKGSVLIQIKIKGKNSPQRKGVQGRHGGDPFHLDKAKKWIVCEGLPEEDASVATLT